MCVCVCVCVCEMRITLICKYIKYNFLKDGKFFFLNTLYSYPIIFHINHIHVYISTIYLLLENRIYVFRYAKSPFFEQVC